MKEKNSSVIPKYFAAANTYRGFISFFDRVFTPEDFNRIYVLKGGPGTGKSSFMKKASAYFHKKGCCVEEIYCSSDPHSLDGVIILKNGKRIAILDGTAPHERDAIVPGAIDEIINLGDGWDARILTAQRKEILSLGKEKSSSYKTAYSCLRVAGQSQEYINNLYKVHFDKFKAKSKAECVLQEISQGEAGSITTRLVSSFGRYGSYCLNTMTELDPRLITIGGDEPAAGLFLDCCFEMLKAKGTNILHLPCALDPSHTDAIYLPDHRLAIVRGDDGEINANELLDLSPADTERLRAARRIHDDALDEAKRWFAIASDLHFRLEEIYGEAMNFDKNNETLNKKIREIENILEIV